MSVLKRIFNLRGNANGGAEQGEAWTDAMLEKLRVAFADSAPDAEIGDAADQLANLYATTMDEVPDAATERARIEYGRAMLALVLDTHTAPPALQLSPDELETSRALLRSFFYGTTDVAEAADRLLAFIEDRFANERFTQAEHLLELFDTEAETRRHNALNLFYESFQVRLRGRRQSSVRRSRMNEYARVHEASLRDEDLGALVDWLSEHARIRLHVCTARTESAEAWRACFAAHGEVREGDALERGLLAPVWRPARGATAAIAAEMAGGTRCYSLQSHAEHLLSCAYFVSRVAGRTGFEYLLGRFTAWVDQVYESQGTRILPEIHLQVLDQHDCLDELLGAAVERHMSKRREPAPLLASARFTDALHAVHRSLGAVSLEALPEGDYNLAGLAYDHLVGFRFRSMEDALRVHRIL